MPDLTTVAAVKSWLGGIPNGEVLEAKITAGGSGYHAATTTVSLAGVIGPGSGFSARPVISGGVIQSLVILTPGSLYLKGTPPTVVFTDTNVSPGSGAQASLNIAAIDGTADAILARLVTAASAFFMQRCGRSALIGPVQVTELRDGRSGQGRIITREFPVTDVWSLKIDGTAVQTSATTQSQGFGFGADGVFLRSLAFTEGYGNIEIVYTAGYEPGSPEAAMIEQAVIELVASRYRRRDHIDQVSQSLGGGASQTISFSQRDVPAEVQTVIDQFSRVMVFA